jgi:hypothetical protein
LEKDMLHDEAAGLGIDCDDQSLTVSISSVRDQLESRCLDSLAPDTAVIEFMLDFVDYDEELYGYSDELIQGG